MDDLSETDHSDDDASIIICIDSEDNDDEAVEKNDKEQEMEISSSDVIVISKEGPVIKQENLHTEPDSSDTNPEISSDLQGENIEAIKEDQIKVTSSDYICSEEEVVILTHPDSSTTVENINLVKSNEGDDVIIVEEKKVEKEKSLHIPTRIIQSLIAEAIISSPKGYRAVKEIEERLIQRVPCGAERAGYVKKLIKNTLENNSDVFMSHIVKNENTFESGFWTLHPVAAAKFVYYDILEKSAFKKPKPCHIQKKSDITDDEKLKNKAVVAIKRSSTLDYWASKRKIAKMESNTMIIPSPDVVNTLKNYGISFETKWEGWESSDGEQENKISKLEEIIKRSDCSVTSGSSKSVWKDQTTQHRLSPVSSHSLKSPLKRKGIKRVRLSDSCSDLDSSDNETPANGSIVHKEHNYVASQDSSGAKNLIENLRKIVQKMDKDCDKKSENNRTNWERNTLESLRQDEAQDFLGFDYDLFSGYWRGWEKSSPRNAERIKEIIRSQEGSRDLEEVLRESDLAVTSCIKELEGCKLQKEVQYPKTCDLDATVQKYLTELMSLFDHMAEEPPISYRVLTVMAICASSETAATVEEICHFIKEHFPFHSHGGQHSLESLVEVVLRLGSPSTFSCHKSRRTSNHTICWRVDSASACGILARALELAKERKQPTRNPLKSKTEEEKMDSEELLKINASKSQPGVIVATNTLQSSHKTCLKQREIPENIHRIQLNGEKRNFFKENMAETHKISTNITNKSEIPTQIAPAENSENRFVKDFNKSIDVPVILSADSYKESIKDKQNVPAPFQAKNVDCVTPEKESEMKSPYFYSPNFKEQELEIIDIDPCLQGKENSHLSSEDDEVIVIDEEQFQVSFSNKHERLLGSDQSNSPNKGTNEGDRSFNCLFLLRCQNLDTENKQYPCYICHKFYGSIEVLNIHFAQTHFESENVHIASSLCHHRRRKSKSIKETMNMVIKPTENSFKPGVPRLSMENLLIDLQSTRSDGVIRYSCSKCNAIFLDKETLNLHTSLFHEDASTQTLIPTLKQVSTPEGKKFYYCDQCSGCFDTEKALLVHKCVPFSRARPSIT